MLSLLVMLGSKVFLILNFMSHSIVYFIFLLCVAALAVMLLSQ